MRCKPDAAKKKSDPQNSTRPAAEMKERAKEGYFVRNPEADCAYCPGGAALYKKSIKKNGDTRYCNKKLCKQCPYKDKCVTSTKYPWKEVDFSKDCLEKKAKWRDNPDPNDDGPKPEGTDKDKKTKKKEPSFHYEKRKKVRFKLRPDREKMDKRKCTSEHPFGTMSVFYSVFKVR